MVEPAEQWLLSSNIHLDITDRTRLPYHHAVATAVAQLVVADGTGWWFLDAGCGMGQISALVAELAPKAELHLCDESETCLSAAAGAVPRASISQLVLGDDPLPVCPAGLRGIVVSSHVIEHLRDPASHVTELIAAARPDGVVVLVVPNPLRPSVLVKSLLRRSYANRGHYYTWDRSHFEVFLRHRCGLTGYSVGPDSVALFPAAWRRNRLIDTVEGLATRLLPWFSVSHVATIRVSPTQEGGDPDDTDSLPPELQTRPLQANRNET